MSTAYMITGEVLSFAKQDAGSFITGSKLKYHYVTLKAFFLLWNRN